MDRQSWDDQWAEVLAEHGDRLADRPPNALLVEVAAALTPGRALDAGCGHGAEALWLARARWQVTAVDVAAAALDHARHSAEALGEEIAQRVEWVQADLGSWTPPARSYDLVTSLYVHVDGSRQDAVRRLASGVAPGGTLLLVGHLPVDVDTGEPTPAAGQTQVTVDDATAALDDTEWTLRTAETRPRQKSGAGQDAVIIATRHL
ncbi:MAG TPA: methyltransferase domain-containing protein [Acidimicrobiales bacterium]|nr:methyltransferase domain-containing protein [Acidimicrobiales bacterium]